MEKRPHRARGIKPDDSKAQLTARIKRAQLQNDMRETFASPHGRRALRFIADICGYQKVSIVGDPRTGDVHDRGTLYNEARRNVYLELRAFLTPEILKDVEFFLTEQPLEIEDL